MKIFVFHPIIGFLAYRLDSKNEPSQSFFRTSDDNGNDQDRLANFFDMKSSDEFHPDNYHDHIPCYAVTPNYIVCNKFDQFSRRDTGFLRFGRKR